MVRGVHQSCPVKEYLGAMRGTGDFFILNAETVLVCHALSSTVEEFTWRLAVEVCWRSLKRALQATWKRTTPKMNWSRGWVPPLSGPEAPGGGTPAAPLSRAQITSLDGTIAFRWGLITVGVSWSWSALRFSCSRSMAVTSNKPKRLENHLRVSQIRWILCGVASISRRRLRRALTAASSHGILLKPSRCSSSRPKQWILKVRNRVSPRRSMYSCSRSPPWRDRRCGMTLAWGLRWAMSLLAHWMRRSPSSRRWVVGSSSRILPGFQCFHLASSRRAGNGSMGVRSQLLRSSAAHLRSRAS